MGVKIKNKSASEIRSLIDDSLLDGSLLDDRWTTHDSSLMTAYKMTASSINAGFYFKDRL